jgi:hypothetical protein
MQKKDRVPRLLTTVSQKHLFHQKKQRSSQIKQVFVELVSRFLFCSNGVDKGETEMMIELLGSNIITRRPTIGSINPETTDFEEDADDEAATPAPTASELEHDDVEFEPYETPVALTPGNWKKKGKGRVMVEETEVESDIEMVEREVMKKRFKSATVDTVRLMYIFYN